MSRREPGRALLVGQIVGPTGFARALSTVGTGLNALGWDVHGFALDFRQAEGPPPAGIAVSGNPVRQDVYGVESIPNVVDARRPDVVLVLNDPWVVPYLAGAVRRARHATRVVAYTPVEGRFRNPAACAGLADVDVVVACSSFGRDEIARAARLLDFPGDHPARKPSVIPHITDTSTFHPLHEDRQQARAQARRQLFGAQHHLTDAFIVLNANTNNPRKRLDLTLRGFAEFARSAPDAFLYLHTATRDPDNDLHRLAESLGIADRIVTTTDSRDHPSVSPTHLNLIYGSCDVGVNTARGEGWGLVAFEHAATGAAQIVPAYGPTGELWTGAAELLPPAAIGPMTAFHDGADIDPDDLSAALTALHTDPARLGAAGASAYRRARSDSLSAAAVARLWDNELR